MSIRTISLVLAGLAGLTTSCSRATTERAPPAPPTAAQKLARGLPKWLAEYRVPSASVALIQDGQLVWSGAYGQQSPTQPADEKTLYDIASLSKPVTAEVFIRLAMAGRVSFDEPMARYWTDPDVQDDPRAQRLTARHVLNHKTGFPNWRMDKKLSFSSEPGTTFGYSGEGFQYLIRYVERKTGRTYQELAEEVLFNKAGMKDTSFVWQDWFRNRQAWPLDNAGRWYAADALAEAMGASEVNTTAADYARFIVAIMRGQDLTPALRKERFQITQNRADSCPKPDGSDPCTVRRGYGFGWYVYDVPGELHVGHSGRNGRGERSQVFMSPSRGFGIVVLTNGANGEYLIHRVLEAAGLHETLVSLYPPDDPFDPEAAAKLDAVLHPKAEVAVNQAALDTEIPKLIERHRVAGVGLGIIRDGRLVWTGHYGEQAPNVAVNDRTVFNAASVAKTVTAETLIALAKSDAIDLDEPIHAYVQHPHVAADPRYRKLTPRLLMSHRSGFLNWPHSYKDGRLAFVRDPGTSFGYSGIGVELAAQYAEKKTGRAFEALAAEHVFVDPRYPRFSMGRMSPWLEGRLAMPMDAKGEYQQPSELNPRLSPSVDAWSAADDLLVTVAGYAGILERLITGEAPAPSIDRTAVLTDLSGDVLWKCVPGPKIRCPQEYGYGLGWMVFDYGDRKVVTHGGGDAGEIALVYYSPTHRNGAVIFVNGANGLGVMTGILTLLGDEPDFAAYYQQIVNRHLASRDK